MHVWQRARQGTLCFAGKYVASRVEFGREVADQGRIDTVWWTQDERPEMDRRLEWPGCESSAHSIGYDGGVDQADTHTLRCQNGDRQSVGGNKNSRAHIAVGEDLVHGEPDRVRGSQGKEGLVGDVRASRCGVSTDLAGLVAPGVRPR